MNEEDIGREVDYKRLLSELDRKIENVEEGYFVTKEMSKETFDKFHPRYIKERDEITDILKRLNGSISNGLAEIEKLSAFP